MVRTHFDLLGLKYLGQDGLGGRALRLQHTRGRALWLIQTWEVAAWEILHLGSYNWEKIPLRSINSAKFFFYLKGLKSFKIIFRSSFLLLHSEKCFL